MRALADQIEKGFAEFPDDVCQWAEATQGSSPKAFQPLCSNSSPKSVRKFGSCPFGNQLFTERLVKAVGNFIHGQAS